MFAFYWELIYDFPMKVTLNGQSKEILEKLTLKNLVEQFCKNPNRVIAEVNGDIIKSQKWNDHLLNDGDTLELVNFVGGG